VRVCLDGRYNPKIVFKKYLFVYRRVPDEKYTLIKDHLCLLYINKNFATIVDNSFDYAQDKSKTKKPRSYDSGLSLITIHKIKNLPFVAGIDYYSIDSILAILLLITAVIVSPPDRYLCV